MIEIPEDHLFTLLWMARRYADMRSTYAPHLFNSIYQCIKHKYPDFMAKEKKDEVVEFFPYAQDGMYNKLDGSFDARPKTYKRAIENED